VASCSLLNHELPFPEVPVVREKLLHLAGRGDDYDVLFVGSSRIHFQVLPSIFDRLAAENGVVVRSFNVGAAGMGSPEDAYLIDEILRRPHRRLRWVFVELSRLGTGLRPEVTARFTYWHDAPRLWLVARRLCGQALEDEARLRQFRSVPLAARYEIWSTTACKLLGHIRYWAIRCSNLGRGTEILDRWLRSRIEQSKSARFLGPGMDGWESAGRNVQQMTAEARRKYEASYADRLARPAGKERGDDVSQFALAKLVATIERAGALPVLVIPPTPFEKHFFPTPEREAKWQIIDFSDVRRNEDLYVPEHRIDEEHVNTAGAELFTAALAREFVALVKKVDQSAVKR